MDGIGPCRCACGFDDDGTMEVIDRRDEAPYLPRPVLEVSGANYDMEGYMPWCPDCEAPLTPEEVEPRGEVRQPGPGDPEANAAWRAEMEAHAADFAPTPGHGPLTPDVPF